MRNKRNANGQGVSPHAFMHLLLGTFEKYLHSHTISADTVEENEGIA